MSKATFNTLAANAGTPKTLSDSEFRELLALSKQGDMDARNTILMHNMGLIYKIAEEVKNPYADKQDVIVDGCLRFLEIINDYDPDKASLSTYIWRPILQYMNKQVPGYKAKLNSFVVGYKETVEYLHDSLGRAPTDSEVAEEMGLSMLQFKNRVQAMNANATVSLDAPISKEDNDSGTLLDTTLCTSTEDASTEVMTNDTRKYIMVAFHELSYEDQDTLNLRILENGEKMSLREAAKVTGMCPETIRQRENVAKEHFRRNLEKYGIIA